MSFTISHSYLLSVWKGVSHEPTGSFRFGTINPKLFVINEFSGQTCYHIWNGQYIGWVNLEYDPTMISMVLTCTFVEGENLK